MEPPREQIVLTDGTPANPPPTTERSRERQREDEQFLPVIVKRSDEAKRHPDDILEHAIAEGVEQLKRPFTSLLLSAVAAGLILGFSGMAVAFVQEVVEPIGNPLLSRLACAFVYPLGFIVSVMSGTQLFTEHTATAVYPVLDRKAAFPRLLRLWAVVIAGNLIGAFASALLVTSADPIIQTAAGYGRIGEHLFGFSGSLLFLSAVLAGWLMAQGAWLVNSTSVATAQMVGVYVVTFLIGIGGLHHSIAGSAEAFAVYLLQPDLSFLQVVRFVGVALAGNLVGGSVFVAVLNYAHVRKTQAQPEGADLLVHPPGSYGRPQEQA